METYYSNMLVWFTAILGSSGLTYWWCQRDMGREQRRLSLEIDRLEDVLERVRKSNQDLQSEIDQRLKSNLQTIISLINMEQRRLDKGQVDPFDALADVQRRLNAMAIVQRAIGDRTSTDVVDAHQLLSDLALPVLEESGATIELNMASVGAEFDVEVASTIGMIASELLRQAVSSLGDSDSRSIELDLKEVESDQSLEIRFEQGVPADWEADHRIAFSRRLVELFCDQISADFTRDQSENDIVWRVRYEHQHDAATMRGR
ncbi:MAG: histidine kinase dimerization/phosphoacceptor domain -containing protein [Pseudomonadota bacterium]